MRLLAAPAMMVVVFALGAYTASSSGVAAATSNIANGDQLTYAVTVELQQHHIKSGPKAQDTTTESSAQGSETFSVYAIGSDGTAYANVALNFKGLDQGQPVVFQTVSTGKILPDGQLRVKAQVGLGISEAIGFANSTTLEIARHMPLGVGTSWTNAAKTPFITLSVNRKVVGKTKYLGFTAYALQSNGSGALLKTADGKPTSGSITVSGTTYYDEQNRLLIGEALRTLTVLQQSGGVSAHDDFSAALNVVLDSWTHPSHAPQASTQPQAQPSAEPTALLTPAAPPTMFGPSPYPTVTARLGT